MHKATKVIIGVVVLGVGLSGCCTGSQCETGPTPETTLRESSVTPSLPLPPPAQQTTYQVPDEDCPVDYGTGLLVATDTAAEVDYINKITACTTTDGANLYLKNNSNAVWVLRTTDKIAGKVRLLQDNRTRTSFRNVFANGRQLLVPGGVVTVDLPPSSVAWVLDLPLTIGWVGHSVVVGKIGALGQTALLAALERRSPAGTALATCTLTAVQYAQSVDRLADKDLSDVVLAGLGAGTATNKCHQATIKVQLDQSATRALADDIDQLSRQTQVLEGIENWLAYAKRAAGPFKLAIHFRGI
jgi:hypothetical protein